MRELREQHEQYESTLKSEFNVYKEQFEARINELNVQLQNVTNEKGELAAKLEDSLQMLKAEKKATSAEQINLQTRLSDLEVERDSLLKGMHLFIQ
jgi:septal ring factor EnvC (AmiA/AmiB activator)